MYVWFIVHIPSVITKFYSHYTIFICSNVKGQREGEQKQAVQVAAAYALNDTKATCVGGYKGQQAV